MGKITKVWFIMAASLVLIGCVLFAVAMSMLRWDFANLATVTYETNNYEIYEVFDSISINTDTADIIFTLSNDGKCTVECYEEVNAKHLVAVEEGSLSIKLTDDRSAQNLIGNIGLNFDSPKITVYLPKTEYALLLIHENTGDIEIPKDFTFNEVNISLSTGDVSFYASASEAITIETSTGDIDIEHISAGSLDLCVSTGKVTVSNVTCKDDFKVIVSTGKAYLTNVACKNVISSGSTGDIDLNNTIAKNTIIIERSTGNVTFECSDANEIIINTNTGDIRGSLLTEKVFIIQTHTGSVDVPKTLIGGKCEIITNTGDILITID